LKLKRLLENKEKKYQEEIIKFSKTIEKYFETYNSEHKIPSKLLKTKKIFKIYKKPQKAIKSSEKPEKTEKNKEIRGFLKLLKDKYDDLAENKFTIFLQKTKENNETFYQVKDANFPQNIMFLGKNDSLWRNFIYKSLDSSQIYQKYRNFVKKIRGLNPLKKYEGICGKSNEIYEKKHERIVGISEGNNECFVEKRKDLINKNLVFSIPNKLYCLCHKPYKEGEKMMGFSFIFPLFF